MNNTTLGEIINLAIDDANVDFLVREIGGAFGWDDLARETILDERRSVAVEVWLEKWAK